MVIAEAGAMMYMTAGIKMETVFGDPSQQQQGFFDKMLSAGKRMLTGESIFMTTFSNASSKRETVAFASPYPGKIIPFHLDQLGGEMNCQKSSSASPSRRKSVSACSAAKGLSCSASLATASPSSTPAAPLWKKFSRQAKRSSSIPVASSPSSPA
jgi:hypothetical protein